jgi:hypothetical protein
MAGYTRVDTINNIADGNVINAADLDGEFDGIQAAFNSSTGHNHDGTAGEGAPILALGPAQDVTISSSVLGVKTTNTVDLGTSSLKFKDFYLAGNASIGGTLAVTGATTLSAALTYGGVTLSNAVTGTGNMVLSASPTLTGTAGFANITASGTLAVTGVATLTAQPVLSSLTASQAVFTDASKGLVSNAITGTGNVVMSASPTLTGTLGAAAATFSGAVTLGDASADAVTVNGTLASNLIFTDNTYDIGASGATRPRTGYFGTSVISPLVDTTNLEVTNLKALDGTAAGSIANSTGVVTLASSVLTTTDINGGTIDGTAIGGASAAAGAFTTLTSNGATTFTAGTASTSTTTGTAVITGGLGVSGRINAANFDGIVGANTAAAGAFTTLSATGVTTVQAGTVSAPAITTTGDTNTGIFFPAADTIAFAEGGTEAMRLDSAGNMGLGVTPSASWGGGKAFVMTSGYVQAFTSTIFDIGSNAVFNGSSHLYAANGLSALYRQESGTHKWFNAATGTAGGAISFTQAMTLDASGNLLLGTTTSALSSSGRGVLEINGASSAVSALKVGDAVKAEFFTDGTDLYILNDVNGAMRLYTNSIERARIDSSGNFLVGATSNSPSTVTGTYIYGGATTAGYLLNNGTTGAGISLALFYSSYSTANETKFEVTSEGNVKSRTNSYAGFSDARLKQGITPASTQWNDIKNIEVVKFQMKSEQFSDAENPWMLGVIAQQVEQVSPGLVDEDVKDGMKTVKYSILYMKAVKALQEAMARIEQLETRITALEGA